MESILSAIAHFRCWSERRKLLCPERTFHITCHFKEFSIPFHSTTSAKHNNCISHHCKRMRMRTEKNLVSNNWMRIRRILYSVVRQNEMVVNVYELIRTKENIHLPNKGDHILLLQVITINYDDVNFWFRQINSSCENSMENLQTSNLIGNMTCVTEKSLKCVCLLLEYEQTIFVRLETIKPSIRCHATMTWWLWSIFVFEDEDCKLESARISHTAKALIIIGILSCDFGVCMYRYGVSPTFEENLWCGFGERRFATAARKK